MKNYINIIHIAVIQYLNDCHDAFFFVHLQIIFTLSVLDTFNQFMYFAIFSFVSSMLSLFLLQVSISRGIVCSGTLYITTFKSTLKLSGLEFSDL